MIRTLPKKLTELGRIRLGWQMPNANGKGKHPAKLAEFRLTSNNKPLLHFAANLYGGTVQPWADAPTPGQYELYTTSNAIDVLVPTQSAVSVQYEIWSSGGCQKRCDGCHITHSLHLAQIGEPCECPEDDQARAALALDGKACTRVLRLNVLLPDLPGMGCWRLESKGFYATAELLGTLEMLQGAGMEHTIIEAVLRLEQRSVKREGKTLHFAVPVLWPKYTPRQLLAGNARALLASSAPAQLLPEAAKSLETHIADLYGDRPGVLLDIIRQSSIGQEIDALLQLLGKSAEEADAYWRKTQATYPDLSPSALTRVRDYLAKKPPPSAWRDICTAHQHLAEGELLTQVMGALCDAAYSEVAGNKLAMVLADLAAAKEENPR